jgi:hypothetical protein
VIPLEDALELIPGSKVVQVMRPSGTTTTGWFFVLPEGPPPDSNRCPRNCFDDYYKILKENARVREPQEDERGLTQDEDVCSGFDFSGCVTTRSPLNIVRDPTLRPNGDPLAIVDPQGRVELLGG